MYSAGSKTFNNRFSSLPAKVLWGPLVLAVMVYFLIVCSLFFFFGWGAFLLLSPQVIVFVWFCMLFFISGMIVPAAWGFFFLSTLILWMPGFIILLIKFSLILCLWLPLLIPFFYLCYFLIAGLGAGIGAFGENTKVAVLAYINQYARYLKYLPINVEFIWSEFLRLASKLLGLVLAPWSWPRVQLFRDIWVKGIWWFLRFRVYYPFMRLFYRFYRRREKFYNYSWLVQMKNARYEIFYKKHKVLVVFYKIWPKDIITEEFNLLTDEWLGLRKEMLEKLKKKRRKKRKK